MSRILLIAALAASACAFADIGPDGEAGLDEIELAADNGIFLDNGLNLANGMNLGNGTTLSNGMNLGNGIDLANGMNLGNGIVAPPSGSGLEQWIDVEPAMRKKILRYLVECALEPGVVVQLEYRGQVETLGSGILGLGPGLRAGLMPGDQQEAVSGCMLARMNGWGDTVQLDLFGPFAGLDTASNADASFSRLEAAYYGNLFDADPMALACTETERTCDEMRGCHTQPDGTCDCGVFVPGSPGRVDCFSGFVSSGAFAGAQCSFTLADAGQPQYYMTGCADGSGNTWWNPVTVWIAPRPFGASCRYDDACESYACNAGVCLDRAANGDTCDSEGDCRSNVCSAGICGRPSGTMCASSNLCQSDVCTNNVCQ